MKSWEDLLQVQRRKWDLPPYCRPEDSTSPWAHLSQQHAVFDSRAGPSRPSFSTPDLGTTPAHAALFLSLTSA
jgi:hypothetical protein